MFLLIWQYIKSLFLLVVEIFLFLLNLPHYFLLFFKGLRLAKNSYHSLISSIERNDEAYKKNRFKNTNVETQFIINNRNEALRLIKEQEKVFDHLFGIFIALFALAISIIALMKN